MSPAFVKQHDIGTRKKKEPFPLAGFDGKLVTYNNGMVSRETQELPLTMGRHSEKTQYDITDAPGCDVVLGLPWLKESNPTINWSSDTIQFGKSQPMPMRRVYDIPGDRRSRNISQRITRCNHRGPRPGPGTVLQEDGRKTRIGHTSRVFGLQASLREGSR
jgi:hypothetical protein